MASPTTTTDDNKEKAPAKRVAVVGAGVSGLAAAYKLKLHGINVTVFEAGEIAGGKLRSISQNGLIWDEGANTMTESEPDVSRLLDDLGLRDKQQSPLSQHKRYIVRNGKPVLVPSNPIALIQSSLLSTQSKLQILLEPFSWKKKNSSDTQESVGAFFQRHFGKEVVEYLINPVVAGTSGGDPESLSMRYSFPELWDLERRFGSLISGAFQSMISSRGRKKSPSGSSKRRRGSFSFLGGMQTLTNALSKEVGQHELNLQSKVLEMSYSYDDNTTGSWSIYCAPDQNKQLNQQPFDAVIMTAPLGNVKEMKITKTGSPFLLNFIPELSYMPVSVIISTFKKENVKRPLEGFGMLVPAKEQENGLKTLGTLFSSMMFPDRAPEDLYLYTTFVGGSRNKELANASRDELKQIVTSDLRQLLGAEGEPQFLTHYYWSKAYPLYGRDYGLVMEAIEKMERELPGYFYAGNHKGGLAVGKAISSGCKAAESVISYLDSYSDEKRC
uniref:protoporphyrinogen oxidase, mitochondrial n=1 Tax=Erigeron canadensis TaxID=72917 RepID=UPI001CB97F79|nr:protoporphyrinogen oxidase, mitochondrial [Erigeron canadensis]XP_043615084.1 protoporphyrinogen oxidase, mitochondrial [Erigeron canadensis]XP_043615085.1 protoporphyrinogen oxidase, mitochondrial [Erigeron canadensis]